jgi:hypothetical protein
MRGVRHRCKSPVADDDVPHETAVRGEQGVGYPEAILTLEQWTKLPSSVKNPIMHGRRRPDRYAVASAAFTYQGA